MVEELYKKIVKKFSAYPESWTRFADFYLKKGDVESARALLPRSLKSLDKSNRKSFADKFWSSRHMMADVRQKRR